MSTRLPQGSGAHRLGATPVAGGRRVSVVRERTTPLLRYVYVAWALTLFDLHFFLGTVVAAPLGRLATVVYLPLLIMMVFQAPGILAQPKRRWIFFAPLLILVVIGFINIPTAVNLKYARDAAQYLLVYYLLAFMTAVAVRTPRQALPIIYMLIGQFVWWALWARTGAQVHWHPYLNNFDAFGGLMVQGAGLGYWLGMGASTKRARWILWGIAAYCVIGVVSSFARGAFLSLVAIAGVIWLRSPRKLLTAAAGIAAVIIVVLAATLLFPEGAPSYIGASATGHSFWEEMMSSFTEGTSEGTGGTRTVLWGIAIQVWKHHPVLGVGGGNVGAYASTIVQTGEIPMFPDPNMLYGFNLHNSYFTILSEFGLIGLFAFGWLLVDFYRKNRALHEPAAIAKWNAAVGGRFDLRYVAYAIEAANMANVLAGIFYASLFMPWFFTTWAANRMLWSITRTDAPSAGPSRAPRRSNGARPAA